MSNQELNKIDTPITVHNGILQGHVLDVLKTLPADSVDCVVTSPPYWGLRDYKIEPQIWDAQECEHEWGEFCRPHHPGQVDQKIAPANFAESQNAPTGQFCLRCGAWRGSLGLEPTPELFVKHIVQVFREVRRVLKPSGCCFVNLGDSYTSGNRTHRRDPDSKNLPALQNFDRIETPPGLKPKDLVGVPWRVAFALQADGWWLRSDIIWSKPNPMPESVTDRPTKSHEYIFLLTKSAKYFWNQEAVREPNHENVSGGWQRAAKRGEKVSDRVKGLYNKQVESYVNTPYFNPSGRNIRSVWTLPTEPMGDWTETYRLVRVELDALSDGILRKESPDCPVHGLTDHPDSNRCGDELQGDKSNHSEHTCDHPALELPPGSSPTDWPLCDCSEPRNLDLPGQTCFPSAIDHSIQNHKTGHAPETMPPYISYAQTPSRIDDILSEHAKGGRIFRIRVNKTLVGVSSSDLGLSLSEQTLYHIVDKSSAIPPECLCEFYQVKTEKSSHFATFPQELVKRCILAGTSEKGCCPKCGKPWEPVVESGESSWEARKAAGHKTSGYHVEDGAISSFPVPKVEGRKNEGGLGWVAPKSVTGWQPTCSCGEEKTVPAVVLDPFLGSGTTGIVAENLYRKWIGIELNPEYIKIAEKRLRTKANIDQVNWLKGQ